MRKHRRGYTLFETVLVVAVLAIAAAVVAPTVRSMYGDAPLTAAADMVKARWADARSRAMAECRPYRFAIMDNTGRFRVAPDGPEFWEGTQGSTPASSSSGQPLIIEDKLPQDVRFCTLPSATGQGQDGAGSDWVCPIVFMPDGTPRVDAEIAFAEAGGGRPLILRLQAATGAVTTSR